MRYLLDTHSLLWACDAKCGKLDKAALFAINQPENTIYVSIVSLWELAIKEGLGKINTLGLSDKLIERGYSILPVSVRHIETLKSLPHHHRDPFDRMLVAQATHDKLTLITRDAEIMQYNIETLPA